MFPAGGSPYGCLDMVGNVWEWVSSIYKGYPYRSNDGREDLQVKKDRVVRGASSSYIRSSVRCAYRNEYNPTIRSKNVGFRVVVAHS